MIHIQFVRRMRIWCCALMIAAGLQSLPALALQCSPTNPGCPAPSTGGSGSGSSNVGVQVDVGSAAKAVGGLFKKKKKKAGAQAEAAAPDSPKIVYVSNEVIYKPKVKKAPVEVAVKPRAIKTVAKIALKKQVVKTKKNVHPVAVAAAAVPAIIDPAPPVPVIEAAPAVEPVAQPEPVILAAPLAEAKIAQAAPVPPASNFNFYAILAAAVAGLGAAGLAAKALMVPKVSMNCAMAAGESQMVSSPSITPPDVAFNVAIPQISVSAPSGLSII